MSSNDQPPIHPNPTAPLEQTSTPPSRSRFPFNVDAPCFQQIHDRIVYEDSPPVGPFPAHPLPPHAFVQPPHAFIQPPHAFVPPPPAGTVISSAGLGGSTSVTDVMAHMSMMIDVFEMDLATMGSTPQFANTSFATLQRSFHDLKLFYHYVVKVVNKNMAAAHEKVKIYQPEPHVAKRIQEVSGRFKEKIELYSELRSSATAQQSSTTTLSKAPISRVDSWQSEVFKAKHVDLKSGESTSTSNSNEAASSSTLSQKELKEPDVKKLEGVEVKAKEPSKSAEPISAGKKTYAEKVKGKLPSVVAAGGLQKSPIFRVDPWKADYFKAMNVDLEPGELTNVQFSIQQQPSTSNSHDAASSSTFRQKEVKPRVEESEDVEHKGKEPTAKKKVQVTNKAAETKKAKAKELKRQKEAMKCVKNTIENEMEQVRANWLASLRPAVEATIRRDGAKSVGQKHPDRDCKRAHSFVHTRLAVHKQSADHRLIAFYTILSEHDEYYVYNLLLHLKDRINTPMFEDDELVAFEAFTRQRHPRFAQFLVERQIPEAEKQDERNRLQSVVRMYIEQQTTLRSQVSGTSDESDLSAIQKDLLLEHRNLLVDISAFPLHLQTCAFSDVLNKLIARGNDVNSLKMVATFRALSETDHPFLRSDGLYLMNKKDHEETLIEYYNLVISASEKST